MCYIFNCFGWTLDLIQRFITFFLACWLMYAVGLGLAVALAAGIAYGYNYSMAEFLTFTRSDVSVYMRRGQFLDSPDVSTEGSFRRSANKEQKEEVPVNSGIDYAELREGSVDKKPVPLADSWQKAYDTRQYAERLVKYEQKSSQAIAISNQDVQADVMPPTTVTLEEMPHIKLTQPSISYKHSTPSSPPQTYTSTNILISMTPNILISTAFYQSGNSQIVMRNFEPIKEIIETTTTTPETPENMNNDNLGNMELVEYPINYKPSNLKNIDSVTKYVLEAKPTKTRPIAEYNDTFEGFKSSTTVTAIPMRRWEAGTPVQGSDYPIEEFYQT
ncbi:unnamed protein product [Diatraea saccharalis]|uniref:Uncharacterized protein n=1 Tax=Diatraea saccharalis TaxID=40085 RepID=A0A9N9QZM1_9NEOP|nr:unnamed protein product [Diatraea saccharalis]